MTVCLDAQQHMDCGRHIFQETQILTHKKDTDSPAPHQLCCSIHLRYALLPELHCQVESGSCTWSAYTAWVSLQSSNQRGANNLCSTLVTLCFCFSYEVRHLCRNFFLGCPGANARCVHRVTVVLADTSSHEAERHEYVGKIQHYVVVVVRYPIDPDQVLVRSRIFSTFFFLYKLLPLSSSYCLLLHAPQLCCKLGTRVFPPKALR